MSDLIEEVIIDRKDENMVRYFKRALICAGVITVFIILCMTWWNFRTKKQIEYSQEQSDVLVKTMDGSVTDYALSTKALEQITDKSGLAITDLALLAKARIIFMKNDMEGALQILENIGNKSKDKLTASYGKLMFMSLLLDKDKKAITDQEYKVFNSFASDLDDHDKPFFASSAVIRAAFAIKNNDLQLARKIVDDLLSWCKAPALIQDQAKAILANLNFSEGRTHDDKK